MSAAMSRFDRRRAPKWGFNAPRCVYVMEGNGEFKVGRSVWDAGHRRRALERQLGFPIQVIAVFPIDLLGWSTVETAAHRRLAPYRTTGEWFKTSRDTVIAAVLDAVQNWIVVDLPRAA